MRFGVILLLAGVLAAQTPSAKEAALGKALADTYSRSVNIIHDSRLQGYVDRLAVRLSPGEWHIAVIREEKGGPTHEPTAYPAGYLFVPASLIVNSQNEAEFAAMVAHGMAHSLDRSAGPIFFDGESAVPHSFLPRQRQAEIDADARAVQMLAAAKFPPYALLDYLRRTPSFAPQRLQALEDAVHSAPAAASAPPSPEFDRLRDALNPRPPAAPSLQHQ
jgi:predicted Zn-dependent protease